MSHLSLREKRIKRRILQRTSDFAGKKRLSFGRNYKATAPVGRPLRNNPDTSAQEKRVIKGSSKVRPAYIPLSDREWDGKVIMLESGVEPGIKGGRMKGRGKRVANARKAKAGV
jgi:hypothetical protein